MIEDAKAFGPAAQPSGCACDSAVHNGLRCTGDGRAMTDCVGCGAHLCQLCYSFHDCAKAEGRREAATSANAEGAKALEIARAEGKAEGWAAGMERAAAWIQYANPAAAQAIRSLIPAAPGGGGK